MKIIRIGVCVLVTFAVLAFGAVEAWSASVLQIGAALLFLWWGYLIATGRGEEIRWSPVILPLLGLELIALLQFVVPLSMYPYLTKMELLRMTSYFTLLFLSGQAFRTPRQWRDFAWFIVLLGFTVAVFAVLQDLTFNGKLYWFREMRYGGIPFGPYVNRNHFAGLMELLIPVGLAMLGVPGVRRQQMPLLALIAAMPVGALLLTGSQGGMIALGCEVILLVILLWMRPGEKKHVFTFLVALILAGGLVGWLGVGQVIYRLSEIRNPEVTADRRVSMARGAYHIFRDHPLIGTGVGTTISVYPAYEAAYDATIVDHVHDDHFEFLAETGIVGAICWLTFIGMLVAYGFKNVSTHQDPVVRAVQLGAFVGCAGLLVHSFVDFNLHIPANALLFYLMAGFASTNPIFGPTN